MRTAYSKISSYCRDHGIQIHSLNSKGLENFLKERKPILCIVSGWYWLISKEAIDSCVLGCFGIHNSLLPAYRGCAPLVWSIIAGDKVLGASLFQLSQGIDDGNILKRWKVKNHTNYNIQDVLIILEGLVKSELGIIIKQYLDRKRRLTPQSKHGVSYGAIRTEKDSEIDWNMSSKLLERHCRALQPPYPQLYFMRGETKYLVNRLKSADFPCFGRPGQVIANLREGVLVKCGHSSDGVLLMEILTDTSVSHPNIKPNRLPVGVIISKQHI